MIVAREVAHLRQELAQVRRTGRTVSFVPTMGALHRGHTSLLEAGRRDGQFLVCSIFVNPTQFGPNEDFDRYPRDEAGDLARCELAACDLVFLPHQRAIYPRQPLTQLEVPRLAAHLCGPFRPGHFAGVALVVAKLFNLVQPDEAYFGEKDAQQLAIIRRMTEELCFPIRIMGCPTVREPDGLALSSRNAYLSAEERARAPHIYAALATARERVRAGQTDCAALERAARQQIDSACPSRIDYVSIVDADELQPLHVLDRPALMAAAVWFGRTRLIDNVRLDPVIDLRAEVT